jgi:hypothetical protein
MDDNTANHYLDRLSENFTTREVLGMLSDVELHAVYVKGAELMGWED